MWRWIALVANEFGQGIALDIGAEDDVAHHGDGRLGVELGLHYELQHVVEAGVVGRHLGLLALGSATNCYLCLFRTSELLPLAATAHCALPWRPCLRRGGGRHDSAIGIKICSIYRLVHIEEKLILRWLGGKNVNFSTNF